MSLVISLFKRCGKLAAYFGKMRRDTLYAFGIVAIFGWMVITYILFTHQPPIFESKFTRTHKSKNDLKAFFKLNENVDRFSVRLKQQIKESDQLLLDLKEIVDDRRKIQDTPQVKSGMVTEKLENPANVVIPILMFACNRVSVSKAIDPLLQYRGDDPARKKRFPIIVSQVRYILAYKSVFLLKNESLWVDLHCQFRSYITLIAIILLSILGLCPCRNRC